MGITHMIKNNGTHWLPHFWPLHQSKTPVFTKIVTQSPIFTTLSKFLKIFHSKTPNRLEFKKNMPKFPLFLWPLLLKDPLFFCLAYMCFRGMVLPQTQKLENVFLTQNRAIWCILLGANLIKVVKTKFQLCRLNQPNCALWKNFIGGQGVIHRPSPWSNTEGDISYNHPRYDSAHLGSLHTYVRLCERRHFKRRAQCRVRWRAQENF